MFKQLKKVKSKSIELVVKKPKLCALVAFLTFIAFVPMLTSLQQDYSVRMWFRTTDPNLQVLDHFEKEFGNDQVILLGVKTQEGIFKKDNIELIRQLEEKLWKVTDVLRVDSLTNYNFVQVDGDDIKVGPFIDKDHPLDQQYLEQKKAQALGHKSILNRFIDKEGKISFLHAQLVTRPNKEESDYRLITQELKELTAPYQRAGVEFLYLGAAPVNDAFREVAAHDLFFLTPLSITVMALVLAWALRSLTGVFCAIASVVLTIAATFGMGVMIGIKFNNITSAVPGVLLAVCLADAMHVFSQYLTCRRKGESNTMAMAQALDKNFEATLFTSLTTSFGFIGLTQTELTPIRDLAILSSFGTMVAWFLTIYFAAPLMMLLPESASSLKVKKRALSLDGKGVVKFLEKWKWSIVTVVMLLSVFACYKASQLEVNSEPFTYFKEGLKIKKDNQLVKDSMGGLGGPQIVIESGAPGGINDPDFLRRVDEFEQWIENREYVNQVVSVLDVIKDVNQNLNLGQPEFYKIPQSRQKVAEDLFLYTLSLPVGMDLNNLMSLAQDNLRLSVFWSLSDSKSSLREIENIENKGRELGLKLYTSGKFFLYNRMNDYVVDTFKKSNLAAIIIIGSIMIFLFRSLILAPLSLAPNVIPLIYGLGVLSIVGGDLDIGTALVTSVCFGITVDDTIHFLVHYRRFRKQGLDLKAALEKIYDEIAGPLIYTTILLVLGFGLFVIGEFTPNIYFGVLCSLVLSMALFLDLIFLPATMLVASRYFKI